MGTSKPGKQFVPLKASIDFYSLSICVCFCSDPGY